MQNDGKSKPVGSVPFDAAVVFSLYSIIMMMFIAALMALTAPALVQGQRPFFAGSRPIGYPTVATTEGLVDRFGEVDGTTQRLPIEANGDRELVDRLGKLPIDQQPFWFINWQALEAHRQNPQTYPQRPNPFIDPALSTGNSNSGKTGVTNSGSSNVNLNSVSSFTASLTTKPPNVNSNVANSNSVSASSNSNSANGNSNSASIDALANRFGGIELNEYSKYEEVSNLGPENSNSKPGNTENLNLNQKNQTLKY